MLTKISLIVALCSNTSMQTVQAKKLELEQANPGAKVTLRFDQKATCDAQGLPVSKSKAK